MKKPSVFVNKLVHKLNNNEEVFATFKNDRETELPENVDVKKKLKNLFDSPKYVYKIDAIIKTKDGTLEKTIVGMNKNEILTINNEKIEISDILDINLKN